MSAPAEVKDRIHFMQPYEIVAFFSTITNMTKDIINFISLIVGSMPTSVTQ